MKQEKRAVTETVETTGEGKDQCAAGEAADMDKYKQGARDTSPKPTAPNL